MEEYYFRKKRKIFYKTNKIDIKRRTIVFIHGLSGSSSAWINYEKHFEKKFNVISFDLRGHGKSFRPKVKEEYKLNKFAEDLFYLLKYLKINQAILVSHSMGVLVAIDFIEKYPKFVESAVFISPSYNPSKRKITKFVISMLKPVNWIVPYNEKIGRHLDYSKYKNTGDWNLRRMKADIKNTGLKSVIISTIESYKFNGKKTLKKINFPVLIVHGKKDTIFPLKDSLDMSQMIKGSKLVMFDKANHIIVLNCFNDLTKSIEEFLDKN
ncbi:MAG TPA: alpha/beta hydrolase [Candidatus Paceibacterota bacterium]|nr:alpha/beta hydrolase [Candidatus Paceibacterota bacterium]